MNLLALGSRDVGVATKNPTKKPQKAQSSQQRLTQRPSFGTQPNLPNHYRHRKPSTDF